MKTDEALVIAGIGVALYLLAKSGKLSVNKEELFRGSFLPLPPGLPTLRKKQPHEEWYQDPITGVFKVRIVY